MDTKTGINKLKGVGPKTQAVFEKLNIFTVGELLRYYPRTYDIYEKPIQIADVEEGRVQTIEGNIRGKISVSAYSKMQVTSLLLADETGSIRVLWYRMPFIRKMLSAGGRIILRGMVIKKKSGLVMEHPEIFYPPIKYQEKLDSMQPVYPLTAGITNNLIMGCVRQALDHMDTYVDGMPPELLKKYDLMDYWEAVKEIHFPKAKKDYIEARKRLVFEEFLVFILMLRNLKEHNEKNQNEFKLENSNITEEFRKNLPFTLTNAQQKVWEEIKADMKSEFSMSRLVQGDVGSGKTILSVFALFMAAENGYQGAVMAPTEVLAGQHYKTISNFIETYELPFTIGFLSGSMTAKQKRECKEKIEKGEIQIVVGTHALIQENVNYQNLAVVITDEQHRFGVRQREQFMKKGREPHVLVMSATPIPRTLAMILYGDMDVSVIDELPASRFPIKNCVVGTDYRSKAYRFMEKQIQEGHQCYIICPMVEENEKLEIENVVDYTAMLKENIKSDIKVEYLHGKMKQSEKDEIMKRFKDNEIQILVSTTVIEVGIDVPNATVMMVENAERFGLAQLHQLRGRVGRGGFQSYCIFMSASKSKETKQRLEILNSTNDGFKIASEDLKLRGPGDLFGIRQSGLMDFKIGDIFQDASILKMANEAADFLTAHYPEEVKDLEQYQPAKDVIL